MRDGENVRTRSSTECRFAPERGRPLPLSQSCYLWNVFKITPDPALRKLDYGLWIQFNSSTVTPETIHLPGEPEVELCLMGDNRFLKRRDGGVTAQGWLYTASVGPGSIRGLWGLSESERVSGARLSWRLSVNARRETNPEEPNMNLNDH